MERFVQLIVGGSFALVAELWVLRLQAVWSPAWFAGLVLVVAGLGELAWGIWSEIDTRSVSG